VIEREKIKKGKRTREREKARESCCMKTEVRWLTDERIKTNIFKIMTAA